MVSYTWYSLFEKNAEKTTGHKARANEWGPPFFPTSFHSYEQPFSPKLNKNFIRKINPEECHVTSPLIGRFERITPFSALLKSALYKRFTLRRKVFETGKAQFIKNAHACFCL